MSVNKIWSFIKKDRYFKGFGSLLKLILPVPHICGTGHRPPSTQQVVLWWWIRVINDLLFLNLLYIQVVLPWYIIQDAT